MAKICLFVHHQRSLQTHDVQSFVHSYSTLVHKSIHTCIFDTFYCISYSNLLFCSYLSMLIGDCKWHKKLIVNYRIAFFSVVSGVMVVDNI